MKRRDSRIFFLFSLFVCLWGVLIVRAAWIQLIPNQRLEALKRRQFETTITLGQRRGDILDRNGNELAASNIAWSVFVDPKLVDDPFRLSHQLARALYPQMKVRDRLRVAQQIQGKIKNRRKRFVWIGRQIDSAAKTVLAEQQLKGVGFVEEPKRVYPNQKLLANALGFVGQEGAGLEGLELRMNDSLSGERREISLRRDARGRPLVVNGQVFTEAPTGATIQLTIDRDLQYVVEQELRSAVLEHAAIAATAVVLDAQTSEILALASLPTFDANDGHRAKPETRRNRAITDLFEPGSTMKTFVVAGAVEAKKLEPNTKVFAEWGQFKIGNRIIREADTKHKFGWITATEALAYSSNIGSTKIAMLLGDKALRDTYQRFGFGEKTGVDLPGETRGVLLPLPWREHLLANVSFGHGLSASALQVANAYAAIANGGWLKRPYIVKSVFDPESNEVVEGKPKTLRRALGDEAAAKLRLMLTAVTGEGGTGFNARVAGFPVAGKTGTAQRVADSGRGYEEGAYISSFAGFLPANEPKFVIFVSLDKPRKDYYGSAVAAPLFARIAKYAVRRAGLSPVLITAKNIVPKDAADKARNPKADASVWRAEQGLSGNRSLWDGGFGSSNTIIASRGTDLAMAEFFQQKLTEAARVADGSILVPDVVGLSLREAMETLVEAGVPWTAVRPSGQGFVAKQNPPAGERWREAQAIELRLRFNDSKP